MSYEDIYIPLHVKVRAPDSQYCDTSCHFYEDDSCSLFNKTVHNARRCYRCKEMTKDLREREL